MSGFPRIFSGFLGIGVTSRINRRRWRPRFELVMRPFVIAGSVSIDLLYVIRYSGVRCSGVILFEKCESKNREISKPSLSPEFVLAGFVITGFDCINETVINVGNCYQKTMTSP